MANTQDEPGGCVTGSKLSYVMGSKFGVVPRVVDVKVASAGLWGTVLFV